MLLTVPSGQSQHGLRPLLVSDTLKENDLRKLTVIEVCNLLLAVHCAVRRLFAGQEKCIKGGQMNLEKIKKEGDMTA